MGNKQINHKRRKREALGLFGSMEAMIQDDLEKQNDPNYYWDGNDWIKKEH